MNTNLKVIAIDEDTEQVFEIIPYSGYVPRLKDTSVIGQRCTILSSLIPTKPGSEPLLHEIVVEDGRHFVVSPDQIGAIE